MKAWLYADTSRKLVTPVGAMMFAIVAAIVPCSGAIRVEGSLTYTTYDKAGTENLRRQVHFAATLETNSWNVQTAFLDSGHVEEARSDGSNVFNILRPSAAFKATNELRSITSISHGQYPEKMSPLGKVVWLAFASSPYLANATNGIMIPPWMDSSSGVRLFDASHLQAYPIIPMSMRFWHTNADRSSKQVRTNLEAVYAVLSVTNLPGKIELPSRFELRRFRPSFAPAEPPFASLYNLFSGEVTNLVSIRQRNASAASSYTP